MKMLCELQQGDKNPQKDLDLEERGRSTLGTNYLKSHTKTVSNKMNHNFEKRLLIL